ncbi:hypothetical protein BRC81_03815 [Halobacteriales archaeon QS_1_68_20]|nr:MAG: hypothetical protein BRC81_03815 [Halobacteriales archaeon QS_1_68_20]
MTPTVAPKSSLAIGRRHGRERTGHDPGHGHAGDPGVRRRGGAGTAGGAGVRGHRRVGPAPHLRPRDGRRAVDRHRPVHGDGTRAGAGRPLCGGARQRLRAVHAEDDVPDADACDGDHLRRYHARAAGDGVPPRGLLDGAVRGRRDGSAAVACGLAVRRLP